MDLAIVDLAGDPSGIRAALGWLQAGPFKERGVRLLFGILIALVCTARPAAPAFLESHSGGLDDWRYKLTFNVSTPDGVKSASSVAEIKSEVSGSFLAHRRRRPCQRGSFVSGPWPGRRPIVALIVAGGGTAEIAYQHPLGRGVAFRRAESPDG